MADGRDRGAGEQARITELLWGPRHRPRRGPKPALSMDAIVAAAIAVADAEGLAALSMQRVADELGFTKMSLYRYTPGKAELTAVMADSALGAPPDLAGLPREWRPRLRAWALAMWPRLLRHPWTPEAIAGPRVMGPNELGWLEAGLASLDGTGLTGGESLDAIVLVTGHVRALAQQALSTSEGAPEHGLATAMGEVLAAHGDDYPRARAAFGAAEADAGQDNALEFGLDRILDGLAALIAQRDTSSPG